MNKRTLIGAVSIALSCAAHAGFVDESSSNPFSQSTQMRIIGSGATEVVHGFAQDIALQTAIGQIVPSRYQLRTFGFERVAMQKVSWSGGKPWPEVLRDLLGQVPELEVVIDANQQTVQLTYVANSSQSAHGSAPVNAQPVAPAVTNPVSYAFHPQQSIRIQLSEHLLASGWKLRWDAEDDFLVAEPTDVIAKTPVEMVEKILGWMRDEGLPYYARIYEGNNVIVVESLAEGEGVHK